MRKSGKVWLLLFWLSLVGAPLQAYLMITIDGTVESMEAKSVVVRKGTTLIRLPKSALSSLDVRPGQRVIAVIHSSTPVKMWSEKKKKSK